MRCPKCGRFMIKLDGNINKSYYYLCRHCDYTSELFYFDNEPLSDNYPLFDSYNIKNWTYKKYFAIPKLKAEHKKIFKEMEKKLGKITDNDKNNLLIWFWEIEKGKEKEDES